MLGLFGTLNLASRSLQTQMAGVEVAGQNLANVNTPGYSRQRVVIQSDIAVPVGVGMEGTGASVLAIQRVVDDLLNGEVQTQASQTGYWNSKQSALESLQTSLNEFLGSNDSGSTGLSAKLSSFFSALQTVATSPTSIEARQAVIGAAQTLATTFKQINTRLISLTQDLNTSLSNQVNSANQLITDIASLNDQIGNAENFTNGTANDLRDLRQQKLEELSKYLNFQTTTAPDGSISISSVNQTLVDGNQVTNLLKTVDALGDGRLSVWSATSNNLMSGAGIGLTGGSIEGTVEVRDGEVADLHNNLSYLASNLITQFNTLHNTGFNLAGGTGNDFFTGTDAGNIAVNQTIANDPSLLQASGTAGATGDGSVALSLAKLATAAQSALSNQSFGGFYGQTVAQVGTALSNANDQVSTQTSVANMLASQRSSVSGVNLDEEMTSLMMFQRAYQASAHMVSTVDQMLQVVLGMGA